MINKKNSILSLSKHGENIWLCIPILSTVVQIPGTGHTPGLSIWQDVALSTPDSVSPAVKDYLNREKYPEAFLRSSKLPEIFMLNLLKYRKFFYGVSK